MLMKGLVSDLVYSSTGGKTNEEKKEARKCQVCPSPTTHLFHARFSSLLFLSHHFLCDVTKAETTDGHDIVNNKAI